MITRLFAASTDTSGSNWFTFGASPAHVGLSDANDGTGVNRQMSSFEPARFVFGPTITQLPATGGILKQVTLGCRTWSDFAASMNVTPRMGAHSFVIPATTTPTTYTQAFSPPAGGFAALAAYDWRIDAAWLANAGMQAIVAELYLDVEWYPITGFQVSVP